MHYVAEVLTFANIMYENYFVCTTYELRSVHFHTNYVTKDLRIVNFKS